MIVKAVKMGSVYRKSNIWLYKKYGNIKFSNNVVAIFDSRLICFMWRSSQVFPDLCFKIPIKPQADKNLRGSVIEWNMLSVAVSFGANLLIVTLLSLFTVEI